jgi:hypothetical protein
MTHSDPTADPDRFEKTFVLGRRPDDSEIDYVRDTGEWIARCVSRAMHLNPTLWASEITPMVLDMSTLPRFRLLSPEDVAGQLSLPPRIRG